MDRTRLRAMLSSGSSILFDVRTRHVKPGEPRPPSFFDYPPLRRTMLLKVSDQSDRAGAGHGLKTLIYLPYDSENTGNGGASLSFAGELAPETLAKFFNVDKIDENLIKGDLEKLRVCAGVPSFAPFLLRDAFDRAGISAEKSFFAITEDEVELVKDNLRARLRPLAAMAQQGAATTMIDRERIETLVRQLWQLDDQAVILPLSRALQIPDDEATSVLYAWIGVSFFQGEFKARQENMRKLINWLVKEADPVDYVDDRSLQSYEADRRNARLGLRTAIMTANETFDRYDQSYQALIGATPNPLPFVGFMKTVRGDFMSLGASLSLIEQCYSVLDFCILRPKRDRVAFDILKQVMSSMREIVGEVSAALKVA